MLLKMNANVSLFKDPVSRIKLAIKDDRRSHGAA